MEITKTEVYGFEAAFRGMRNPMDSWHLSDSISPWYLNGSDSGIKYPVKTVENNVDIRGEIFFHIGPKDMDLAQRLIKAGSEHCKFLRQIHVWADMNMPRYWWSEFDTYKFNNKNSTSTMHKLLNQKTPITRDKFVYCEEDIEKLDRTIADLNEVRELWCSTKDGKIRNRCLLRAKRLLPESFLQLRTVETNYAELRNIYFQRRHHRLEEEWVEVFCSWVESLPYAKELIFRKEITGGIFIEVERQFVFESIVGSHNYNLNTENSDKDYKVFTLPSFEDLYNGEMYCKSVTSEDEDREIHDIRKCTNLWCKANISFLEVLFSQSSYINMNLDNDSISIILTLFNMKNDIARMNLKCLYNASIGMHRHKLFILEKGTENTKYLVDKFGYDTKAAMHAYRVLDFLERFANNNFSDFKSATWYDTSSKNLLLDIKNGKYKLEDYKELISKKLAFIEESYKDKYISQPVCEETKNTVENLIKKLVKLNVCDKHIIKDKKNAQ